MLLIARHGPSRVAFDLTAVREVLRMLLPSPLPGAPESIIGAINLRGEMLPVLDLEKRLRAGAGQPGVDSFLVVTEADGGLLAIAVTHVEDLHPLAAEEWKDTIGVKDVPFLGLARMGVDVIPVLDPRRLLDARESIALADAMARLEMEVTG